MGVVIVHKGSFKKIEKSLQQMSDFDPISILNRYGAIGVSALSEQTPIDTGKTASSWSYEVKKTDNGYSIIWSNSNINNGVNIAVILQYGHGTGNGGYVTGIDYINPALQPIFDQISEDAWYEVTKV